MDFIAIKHNLFYLCMSVVTCGFSQNFIKNPSFEVQENCPTDLGNFEDDVRFWTTPTDGSTDYFNGCSKSMGTPKNFNGAQPADFGVGYAGFYLYAPDDYREYVQAELSHSLVKGKKYKLSFYISLAEQSEFAVREFGILFSKNHLKFSIRKVLSKMHLYKDNENEYHHFDIAYPKFLSDTEEWVLIQKEFKAKGTEQFLTVGNFKNNRRTRLFETKRKGRKAAYYYIDMVLLESAESNDFAEKSIGIIADKFKPPIELDKLYVFENVFFNFDKFDLLKESKEEIEKIYRQLYTDNNLQISIEGHTDAIGSAHYNQKLSNKRANAVADYLVELGVPLERISWIGHGGTAPVASNASEQGRSQNRRVEFIISKKE